MKNINPISAITFLLLLALNTSCPISIAYADAKISGKVIGISDGDTITVLQANQEFRIRLYGIDAPEKNQDFGTKAKLFLSDLIYKKDVTVVQKDVDHYGRIVGMVYFGNTNINEEIVRSGFAWVYQQYCKDPFCKDWIDFERQAKDEGKGLWCHPESTPPWEYRRNEKASKTDIRPLKTDGNVYHGNRNSNVFHQSSCKDFNCKNCTVIFKSRDEAIKAGYRSCGCVGLE